CRSSTMAGDRDCACLASCHFLLCTTLKRNVPVEGVFRFPSRVPLYHATVQHERQTIQMILVQNWNPMKITKIESLSFARLPCLLFVRVHTDAGIIGLGETYDKVPGSRGALHGTLAPILLGNDPREIEGLWRFCFE